METTTAQQQQPSPLWRDWGHYAKWWGFWFGAGMMLMSLGSGSLGDRATSASSVVLNEIWVLAIGVAIGLALATVFAVLQNTLNKKRRKPLSWAFAIILYITLSIGFAIVRS